MPYVNSQLEFLLWLASFRSEPLNAFFKFLNYFDSQYFTLVLIPLIWIGFSYKWGLRLSYLSFTDGIVNEFLKISIGWPRPSHLIPELGLFDFPTNGFPSGGSQTCFLFGSLLIYYGRSRWTWVAWVVGLTYIFLISLSRLYLGVHFPLDVLGGWTVGGLLFLLFINSIDPIERYLKKKGLLFTFFLSQAIPLLILLVFPKNYIVGALAVGLGACLSLKYHLYLAAPKSLNEGLARAFFGIATIFALYLLWPKSLPLEALYFTMSLWISLAISPLWKKLRFL